jgi:hypothetical protein
MRKSMMTGMGTLAITVASAVASAVARAVAGAFLVFVDHRHELAHPLHIHSLVFQS